MKSKVFVGGLIAAVAYYLLGWLLFGILLHGYYEANTIQYIGLNKEQPVLWALIIANLAWGLLLAYVMELTGAHSMPKGFAIGFLVFFLVTLGVDMFFISFMNLMSTKLALVDTAANSLLGGVVGAIVGWAYGLGEKSVA